MSLESYHYKGSDAALFPTDEPANFDEFHFHPLNAFGEGIATYDAL